MLKHLCARERTMIGRLVEYIYMCGGVVIVVFFILFFIIIMHLALISEYVFSCYFRMFFGSFIFAIFLTIFIIVSNETWFLFQLLLFCSFYRYNIAIQRSRFDMRCDLYARERNINSRKKTIVCQKLAI